MRRNNFILGADPEVFLLHSNKKPKSAIDIIKGTKENPFKISNDGHSVQVDNVLLEFNVPPSDHYEKMYNDIQVVIDWFYSNLPKGDEVSMDSSMDFPKEELNHPKALEFGCDPDFSAWKVEMNESPNPDTTLRTAGGHIHISYPNANMDKSLAIIRACDLFLGVPSVLFDNDTKRRLLYGKAGAFRFKNYSDGSQGVEYRTLSNFWIKSKLMVEMIFDQMDKVFDYVNSNDIIDNESDLGMNIIKCIDNSDKEFAVKLIEKYDIIDLNKYK